MTAYEYQVIPAPAKGVKVKGEKTPEGRFALALQQLMNRMGAEGWEYQRADTLPSTERAGLTGTTTNWRHVLVFRRPLAETPQDTGNIKERPPLLVISPPREPANDPGRKRAGDTGRLAHDPAALLGDDGGEDSPDVTTGPATPARTRESPDKSDV